MAEPRRAGGDAGFALLIVLWTLVLVTALLLQLTAAGRADVRLAGNLRDAALAEAAADGGVHDAISHLLDPSAGRHWSADASLHELRSPHALATIRIGSEEGKVDLNGTPTDVLAALLRGVGLDQARSDDLALAIALWRFPSAEAAARKAAYRQAGRDYVPPGAAFQSVAELGLVLGMTPDIVARLRPHVTIYHEGEADPRRADPLVRDVLRAQGASEIAPSRDTRAGEVVNVEVTARSDLGSRAARRAVIRIGAEADQGGWRILAWD